MKVSTWKAATYGIRVGQENVERYFSREWRSIEVEIDGELHSFRLSSTFWGRCPEFRGKLIGNWLQARGLASWPHRRPHTLELIPLGGNRFRLTA